MESHGAIKRFRLKRICFFYTNLGSRKAADIKTNDRVCLHFPWLQMDRQVIISGHAQPLSKDEVLRYFVAS